MESRRRKSLQFGTLATVVCGLVGIGITWAGQANSGWTPFTSIQVVTAYDTSGGKRKLIGEHTGVYMRNQDGSVYNQFVTVLGPPGPGTIDPATLQDATTGITYRINYHSRTLTIVQRPAQGSPYHPLPPPTAQSFDAVRPHDLYLGAKIVNGVQLQGWKARQSADGILGGEVWVDPSLNYTPVITKIVNSRDHLEVDSSLQNIRVGLPKDVDVFKVPSNFSVLK